MTAKEAIDMMLKVKQVADDQTSTFVCQGQGMDGYSELANYRSILENYLENTTSALTEDENQV